MPRARPGSRTALNIMVAHHGTNSTCTRAITVSWSIPPRGLARETRRGSKFFLCKQVLSEDSTQLN